MDEMTSPIVVFDGNSRQCVTQDVLGEGALGVFQGDDDPTLLSLPRWFSVSQDPRDPCRSVTNSTNHSSDE